MQALGAEGYRASIVDVWRTAEELMTLLADHRPILIGRAVRGEIDAGVTLHIRLYTAVRIGAIADLLVDFGYPDPDLVTAETTFGRFDRLVFEDDESGLPVQITRCPPGVEERVRGRNLATSAPLDASADLHELRRLIAEHADPEADDLADGPARRPD